MNECELNVDKWTTSLRINVIISRRPMWYIIIIIIYGPILLAIHSSHTHLLNAEFHCVVVIILQMYSRLFRSDTFLPFYSYVILLTLSLLLFLCHILTHTNFCICFTIITKTSILLPQDRTVTNFITKFVHRGERSGRSLTITNIIITLWCSICCIIFQLSVVLICWLWRLTFHITKLHYYIISMNIWTMSDVIHVFSSAHCCS